jgi:hypothetical protein
MMEDKAIDLTKSAQHQTRYIKKPFIVKEKKAERTIEVSVLH